MSQFTLARVVGGNGRGNAHVSGLERSMSRTMIRSVTAPAANRRQTATLARVDDHSHQVIQPRHTVDLHRVYAVEASGSTYGQRLPTALKADPGG